MPQALRLYLGVVLGIAVFAALSLAIVSYLEGGIVRTACVMSLRGVADCHPPQYTSLERLVGAVACSVGGWVGWRVAGGRL